MAVTAPAAHGFERFSSSFGFVSPSKLSGVYFWPVKTGISKHIMNWINTDHEAKYLLVKRFGDDEQKLETV